MHDLEVLVKHIQDLEKELLESRNILTMEAIKCEDCEKEGKFPWYYVSDYEVSLEELPFDVRINDITSGSLNVRNREQEMIQVKRRTCPNGHNVYLVVESGQLVKDGDIPQFNLM